jgi:corrinoid protein of di/trimethylamine methyltransferase
METDLLQLMKQSVIDGDQDAAVELSRRAIHVGFDPLRAINDGFAPGLSVVGEQFEQGEMFLPDLILAGAAMKAATSVLGPELKKTGTARQSLGTVVLGTVKGDIHEIGKSLVATMLTASGFEVVDLGVDVASDTFADKAEESRADIVGVSALLTTTMAGQKNVVEALQRRGLRPRVKVMVGGAPVTEDWVKEIGADGYGKDAVAAVALAKSLVGK